MLPAELPLTVQLVSVVVPPDCCSDAAAVRGGGVAADVQSVSVTVLSRVGHAAAAVRRWRSCR